MNVSTCLCAATGKVSYLAIKVCLLITNHATPSHQALQSAIAPLRSLVAPSPPPELQRLNKPELKAEIEKKQKARAALQGRIEKLSQEQEDYLAAERKRLAGEGKGDSLDGKVAASIGAQASRKGIEFQR